MSTYVLMRILESAPRRYEMGIRLLTLGGVDRAYDRLVRHVGRGQRILDIGCGTGALALRAARKGAQVKGIDVNAQMLEIAEQRMREEDLHDSVDLTEMGVAELDTEETGSYDAVMAGLCFSELTDDELTYTLVQVARILRPGGRLLVADEVEPRNVLGHLIQSVLRTPLAAMAYLITGQTTHPVADLAGELAGAGLTVISRESSMLGSFGELVAEKPTGGSP